MTIENGYVTGYTQNDINHDYGDYELYHPEYDLWLEGRPAWGPPYYTRNHDYALLVHTLESALRTLFAMPSSGWKLVKFSVRPIAQGKGSAE